jgi:hypothetical protein
MICIQMCCRLRLCLPSTSTGQAHCVLCAGLESCELYEEQTYVRKYEVQGCVSGYVRLPRAGGERALPGGREAAQHPHGSCRGAARRAAVLQPAQHLQDAAHDAAGRRRVPLRARKRRRACISPLLLVCAPSWQRQLSCCSLQPLLAATAPGPGMSSGDLSALCQGPGCVLPLLCRTFACSLSKGMTSQLPGAAAQIIFLLCCL